MKLLLLTLFSVSLLAAVELKPAPEFSGRTLQGKLLQSEKLYTQKATLVFFWHSCCGIDKGQLSLLKELYTSYQGKGLEVVGIALDGVKKSAQVKKAIKKYGMQWPSLIDKNSAIKNRFNPIMLPTLYIINEQGEIVDYFSGFDAEAEKKQRQFVETTFSASTN